MLAPAIWKLGLCQRFDAEDWWPLIDGGSIWFTNEAHFYTEGFFFFNKQFWAISVKGKPPYLCHIIMVWTAISSIRITGPYSEHYTIASLDVLTFCMFLFEHYVSVMHASPFRVRYCQAYVQILLWVYAKLLLYRAVYWKYCYFVLPSLAPLMAKSGTIWRRCILKKNYVRSINNAANISVFFLKPCLYLLSKWVSHLLGTLHIINRMQ